MEIHKLREAETGRPGAQRLNKTTTQQENHVPWVSPRPGIVQGMAGPVEIQVTLPSRNLQP